MWVHTWDWGRAVHGGWRGQRDSVPGAAEIPGRSAGAGFVQGRAEDGHR